MNERIMKTGILSVCIWTTILIAATQQQSVGQSTGQQATTSTPLAKPDLMPQASWCSTKDQEKLRR